MSSHMRRRIHALAHVLCKVTIKSSLEKCPSMRNEEEDTCQVCKIRKRTHSITREHILCIHTYCTCPSMRNSPHYSERGVTH